MTDYKLFDKLWDEEGAYGAFMSLPTKPREESRSKMPQENRCLHCGVTPTVIHYGLYRDKRSISNAIKRKIPTVHIDSSKAIFCECWDPEAGFEATLETR